MRDAQTMLERSKGDSTGKTALRQLKNQLEDAECARAVAVKAKQALEQELNETQAALEEASRSRSEAEDRANTANRERTELVSQLEENEEELAEVRLYLFSKIIQMLFCNFSDIVKEFRNVQDIFSKDECYRINFYKRYCGRFKNFWITDIIFSAV